MVENVHKLEDEGSADALGRPKILRDRSIEIPERESTEAKSSRTRVDPENRPPELVEDRAGICKHVQARITAGPHRGRPAGRLAGSGRRDILIQTIASREGRKPHGAFIIRRLTGVDLAEGFSIR